MGENVVNKLRSVAKVVHGTEMAISIIAGCVLLFWGFAVTNISLILSGAAIMVLGVMAAELQYYLILCFAEMSERTSAILEANQSILSEAKGKTLSCDNQAAEEKTEKPHADTWCCTGCGTQNSKWYGTCSKCGKRKDN